MSVLHNNPFLLASGNPTDPIFPLQRSLRFRSSASAYFARTPATAGNRKTWTYSGWVKRGSLGTVNSLISANFNASGGLHYVYFTTTDTLNTYVELSVGIKTLWTTNAVFRDPSAWYHVVIAFDTTQSAVANMCKMYINGILQSATVSNVSATYISQNADGWINNNIAQYLGSARSAYTTQDFDGYLTEVNFIDGQALTPLSFGGYNAGTNVWEPRKYSGSYGTNGFYLNFQNPASTGADSSGNSNNWTPNNIQTSNSALVTYDSMLDVPTLSSGNNANFATLNPLDIIGTGGSITSGNLQLTGGTGAWYQSRSAFALTTGKWYWEITIVSTNVSSNGIDLGIANSSTQLAGYGQVNKWIYNNNSGGRKSLNGTSSAYGTAFLTNNIVGVAFDADLGTLEFYINGSTQGVAASTGLPNPAFPIVECYGTDSVAINFGQRPFTYTPPSGFKSLNTFNLPEPTIPRGDKYFEQYLYTGNGGGLQIGEIQKPMSLFNLDRSLRFRASNSAYLSRTIGTPTNSVKCTFSGWVKRGTLGTTQIVFGGFTGTDADTQLYFSTTNKLTFTSRITNVNGAAFEWAAESARVFNDPSQWLHIVVKVDTSTAQATNNDYYTVYVNGIAETFTTVSGASLVSAATVQNRNTCWNVSGYTARLGTQRTTNYFDGYLSDIYFIDGQALVHTDFGTYDGNNYWTPKAYTGTYGTNGFHLEFEDYSGTTASTIGKDTSGNSNNWTPSGISLTAPANTNAAWDSMVDVPTQTSTDAANFCTIDRLRSNTAITITEANLKASISSSSQENLLCNIGMTTGKWYWEVTTTYSGADCIIGIVDSSVGTTRPSVTNTAFQIDLVDGRKWDGATSYAYASAFTSGDTLGIALDLDVGSITFYKNGVSLGVAFNSIPQGKTWYASQWKDGAGASYTSYYNFGQRPFKYSNYGVDRPAATFKTLNSFNIAEVVGDVETPDLVRIKSRSATTPAMWFNSISGEGKYILGNNNTAAEATDVNSLIQFNKNGLLIGNNANINTLSATYVADVWKAGSSTVTNNAGSITSQVRANPISGISVVSFTYVTGTSTIGHGLSTTPKFIIVKRKDSTGDWYVNHASLSSTNNNYLLLNSTATQGTASWGGSPSATTFSVSGNILAPGNYIAYCFAEIDGFSKFGSYVSNADPNGPFVYTGFRPRWVMIKQRDAIRSWIMYDTTRSTYNIVDKYFFMEGLNNNEQTAALLDITSNGFKHRSNNVNTNTTAGQVYIYMAFAENPFKYALAR